MKKVLCILMVFVLAFSMLAGCGKNKSNKETVGVTDETANTPTAIETGSKAPLSFKVMTVNFGEVPTGKTVQNAWLAEMEKLMGRKLNIEFEYVNMSDYGEKLKIMLASGNLPDLITAWGIPQSTIFEYGNNGTFVDLTANMDKLPNYKKYLDAAPDSLTNLYSADNKLYGFYAVETNWQAYSGGSNYISNSTAFRKDIFDANGLEIPKTVDEVYAAAKKLKEIYPDKYPIMLMEEWQQPIKLLINANHATLGSYYNGTEYAYGPLQEGYKEALMEMNKWYKEGLISPDFFTQTQADGNAAMAAGDGMIIPACWEGYPGEWSVKYPDQDWVLSVGIENPKYGKPWAFMQGSADDVRILNAWSVLVNASSKNVDDLLQFMDYQMSDSIKNLLTWGIEGETYTETDGEKHFVDSIKADPVVELAKYGFGTGTCRSGIFPQIQDELISLDTAYSQKMVVNGEVTTTSVPAYLRENFNIEQANPDSSIYKTPLTSDESETIANIMTPVTTYEEEQRAAFISGSRSFDEWDTYIKELKSMGDIQNALDIYNSKVIGSKN